MKWTVHAWSNIHCLCTYNVLVMSDYDFMVKLLIIGDEAVGKSAILHRYVDDEFLDVYLQTIGADFRVKTETIDGKVFKCQIWDTTGAERFRAITNAYYRGCDGVTIIFDVTNLETFNHVEKWMSEARTYCGRTDIPVILVGNKIDVVARQVSTEQGQALANELNIPYVEVSAKQDTGVRNVFLTLLKDVQPQKLQENRPVSMAGGMTVVGAGGKKSKNRLRGTKQQSGICRIL